MAICREKDARRVYLRPPSGFVVLDLIVTLGGIVYGSLLVSVVFSRNRFTEALRIDTLIVPKPTDATRLINVGIGLLLVAYNAYSLFR